MATAPRAEGLASVVARHTIRQVATVSPEEQEAHLAVGTARNRARPHLQEAQETDEATKNRDLDVIADYDRACALVLDIAASDATAQSIVRLLGEETQTVINFLDKALVYGITSDLHVLGRVIHLFSELAICADIMPTSFMTEGVDYGTVLTREICGPQIRKGEYRNRVVRVKGVPSVSEEDSLRSVKKKIIREIVTWAHLSHPNVAAFYGVSDQPLDTAGTAPSLFSISPWAENLLDFLLAYPTTPRAPLISDIIAGLEYLHSLWLVHGGLQRTSILVSRAGRAMISDFTSSQTAGLSTAEPLYPDPNLGAPELWKRGARVTEASDIWSFGCICYETFTGNVGLYKAEPKTQLATAFLQSKLGPILPLHEGEVDSTFQRRRIWETMEKCWNRDPSRRPKATYLSLFFTNLIGLDGRPSAHSSQDPIIRGFRWLRARTEVDYTRVYRVLHPIQSKLFSGGSREVVRRSIPGFTSVSNQPVKLEDALSFQENELSPDSESDGTDEASHPVKWDSTTSYKTPRFNPESSRTSLGVEPTEQEDITFSRKSKSDTKSDWTGSAEKPMKQENTLLTQNFRPRSESYFSRPTTRPMKMKTSPSSREPSLTSEDEPMEWEAAMSSREATSSPEPIPTGKGFRPMDSEASSSTPRSPPASPSLYNMTPYTKKPTSLSKVTGSSDRIRAAADKKRIRPRRFECDICGDRFTSRQNLTNHMNSHAGVSPFQCPHCSKTYRHSRSLNRHIQHAHAERPKVGLNPREALPLEKSEEVEEEGNVLTEGSNLTVKD